MAFGLSGAHGRPQMVGADVVVAYYDTVSRVFRAEDYYLSHLSQCDGKQGVCPDVRIGGRNDVDVCTYTLIHIYIVVLILLNILVAQWDNAMLIIIIFQ